MCSDKGINKYIDLYKKKYGIKLSTKEAGVLLSSLVNFVKIVNFNVLNNKKCDNILLCQKKK